LASQRRPPPTIALLDRIFLRRSARCALFDPERALLPHAHACLWRGEADALSSPPSLTPFSLRTFSPPERYFLVFPCLLATIAGLIILLCCPGWRGRLRGHVSCLLALLLFPFLFLATLSLLTDWPIFSWYGYPLVASGIGGAALLIAPESPFARRAARTLRWPALALLVLAWAAFAISGWRNAMRPDKVGYSLYLEAVDIKRSTAHIPVSTPWATAPVRLATYCTSRSFSWRTW
jgi:hypothetical protein